MGPGNKGLAAIDIDNHTTFHLEAVQTLNPDGQNLSDWYAGVISERKDTIKSISKSLVADAWFSKKSFADQVISSGMHLVSRLRDDADLKYLCKEPPTGKKGRPGKYSGKISIDSIDKDHFSFISEDHKSAVYAAEVHSNALRRNSMLVHFTYLKANGKDARKLYFSTDVEMEPGDVRPCPLRTVRETFTSYGSSSQKPE